MRDLLEEVIEQEAQLWRLEACAGERGGVVVGVELLLVDHVDVQDLEHVHVQFPASQQQSTDATKNTVQEKSIDHSVFTGRTVEIYSNRR